MNPNTVGSAQALGLLAAAEGSRPLVVIRCGARMQNKRRCREKLGEVLDTSAGPLLHGWASVPRTVLKVDTSALADRDPAELAQLPGTPADLPQAMERGYVRRGGDLEPLHFTALLAEGWYPAIAPACRVHGPAKLDRGKLLAATRRLKPGGPPAVVYASGT